MRKLFKRIEAAFAAVAFAEEGEVEMARHGLAEAGREDAAPGRAPGPTAARGSEPRRRRQPMRQLLRRIEAAFAAVAFAEEGEVEMARHLLAEAGREDAAPDRAPDPKAARGSDPRRSAPRREKVARLS